MIFSRKSRLFALLLTLMIGLGLSACISGDFSAETAGLADTILTEAFGDTLADVPTNVPGSDPSEPTEPAEPTEPEEAGTTPEEPTEVPTNALEDPTDTPIDTPAEVPTEEPSEELTTPEETTETPTDASEETTEGAIIPEFGYQVGDVCYDATLHLFDGASHTVSDGLGSITILNFWGSWCPPCKNELPDFNRIAEEYIDDVIVVAIHSEYGMEQGDTYIRETFSTNSPILFAFDPNDTYYNLVARETVWPITVVLDQNGVITNRFRGAVTYSQLKNVVSNLLPAESTKEIPALTMPDFKVSDVPGYTDQPYVAVNGNIPFFTPNQYVTESYEYYSPLDSLGRCGTVVASIGRDLMPTEDRESISSVKPTGWHSISYDKLGVTSLYNRSHLIAFRLTGENANKENLITGTQYMNQTVMTRFENMVADYITETGNHVLYRVTPIFTGNNLVADGVLMEGWSVEDNGDGICFCVYLYNVQPGVEIDYATGESHYVGIDLPEGSPDYILNTNTKKFHKPTCSNADTISDKNRKEYHGSREDLIAEGYKPGGCCNP